jgi:hypothetical protein
MEKSGVGAAICCMAVCLSILALPFIVCDLFYGYTDTTCVNLPISNTSINFTLGTWLKVNGYMSLALIALLVFIAIFICCSEKAIVLFVVYIYIILATSFFTIAWLIIGAVMFWGYLYPNNLCSSSVTGYVFTRLILGIIAVFVNLLTARRQQKQAAGDSL